MNRSFRLCISVACSAAALLTTVSCSQGSSGNDAECTYNVGYSEPAGSQETNQMFGKSMIEYGKQSGICVTVTDAQLDVNKQLQDVNQFIAQKMDAIIVFPLSQSTLDPVLKRAKDQGIKVVGFSAIVSEDQPADMGPYDAFYDQNIAFMGARQLGDFVNAALPSKSNVLGVGLSTPVPTLKAMVDNYQINVTAPNGDLNWLGSVDNKTDDIAGGQSVVNEAITRFRSSGISAVMAYNTSSGVGAIQALRGSEFADAVVVAQNGDSLGVQALESGQMAAMVDVVPWRSGMMLVDLTEKTLAGEAHPSLVFGRTELYTPATVGERRDWNDALAQISSGELNCENGGCTPEAEQTVAIPT